jgi:hypothetical protein
MRTFQASSNQDQMPIYVNLDCVCGAWCDAISLNFCRAGAEPPPSEVVCPNFGWRNILHHEYGHYVIYCGGIFDQGQYGEGMADCFSVILSDDPLLGAGWHSDCNRFTRTADNEVQYPCVGEIHDCGCLLSGCVWDIRNELILTEPEKYGEILSRLAVNSILVHTGATITPQIAVDFLTLDDTDAYLINGTPHWDEICTGFSEHGMGCPALGTGLFVHPEGGLASVGDVGGPFEPDEVVYTLENLNDTEIRYTVTKTQAWVSVDIQSGALGAHQSVDVTVSIDSGWAGQQEMGRYTDTVTFTNTTDHDGDTTRPVELTIPARRFNFDANPGWTTQGEWKFGDPAGLGGAHGNPDPDTGATGFYVYGVNLSGDYSTTPGGPYYLATGQIELGDTVNRQLRFKRWLNTDHLPYARAAVEASVNGINWTQLWSNGTLAITEDGWSTQTYDLSGVVANQSSVYVRWGYRINAGAWAYSGWNIDDVEFLADPRP